MARGKGPNGGGFWLAAGALALHVAQAIRHQRTCPRCQTRDLIEIAFDVAHLWGFES